MNAFPEILPLRHRHRHRAFRFATGVALVLVARLNGAAAEPAGETSLPQSVRELREAVATVEVDYSGGWSGPISRSGVAGVQSRYEQAFRTDTTGVSSGVALSPSEIALQTARANALASSETVRTTYSGVIRTGTKGRLSVTAGDHLRMPHLGAVGAALSGGEAPRSHGVFDQFADAPFLPQLDARIHRAQLSGGLLKDVEHYLIERESLAAEIDAALAKDASNSAALAELAQKQAARLQAWEQLGEELRQKLARGNVVVGNAFNDFETRRWRLDATALRAPRARNQGREVTVMRQTAYFSDGLAPVQRRLLRESAAELAGRRAAPDSSVAFLPEFTRLELPAGLPAELLTEINAVGTLKQALQQELRDAAYFNDAKSESARRDLFTKLAAMQAPRLAELERRVEALRPQLVQHLGGADATTGPELSPGLREQLERFVAAKRNLQTIRKQKLAEASERRPESPRVLRLHTTDNPAQGEQLLAALAMFEGRFAESLDQIDQGGAAAAATDLTVGRELRETLAPLMPKMAGAAFRFSCDRTATTDEQRAAARENFPAVWAQHHDLTAPLEQEAQRLQTELARGDATGTPALIKQLRVHWRAVERTARSLSFELKLTEPRETELQRQRRLAQVQTELAELEQRENERLGARESEIRLAIAGLPGGEKLRGVALETFFEERERSRQISERDVASQRYRAAVLTPGLSPAQRRVLLAGAIVEWRRSGLPAGGENFATR